jgi:putative endonuclease
MTHIELGNLGEKMALDFLQKKNFTIHSCNYRFKKNEVDIIAENDGKLIVVEVKTRETAEIGEPYKAVTRSKQRHIITVVDYYVKEKNIDLEVQFDVISIVHNSYRTKIEHIENAFFPIL